MTAAMHRSDVYELTGSGIEITFRRRDGELTIVGDEFPFAAGEKFVADVVVQPEIGIVATASLLPSSRNRTRITLTLVLPEVNWAAASTASADVTGGAIIANIFTEVMDGPPPVLQSYEVRPLQGRVSPG